MHKLGEFEVRSGRLIVSDPGREWYDGSAASCMIENVRGGRWVGLVDRDELPDWGEVNSRLTACHESAVPGIADSYWIKSGFVHVTGELAGIFDAATYRADLGSGSGSGSAEWYEACCDKAESGEEAGTVHGGVVSRSGAGNGTYGVYMTADAEGRVVGVKLVFVKQADL